MRKNGSFTFHIQLNINCKKCIIVAIVIFSQFTPIYIYIYTYIYIYIYIHRYIYSGHTYSVSEEQKV